MTDVIQTAAPGSIYEAIYQEKMAGKDNVFVPTLEGLELVLKEDKHAHIFYHEDYISSVELLGYGCKVRLL